MNKATEFQVLLHYEKDRHLVGIKFIRTKEEYDLTAVREASHQMFFCMFVKAATVGHSFKIRDEHIYCSAAAEVLGFRTPDSDVVSGKIAYNRKFYETECIAAKMGAETPYLTEPVYGMVVQPVENYEDEPDIVLSFSNAYTAMRIMQAYSYKYGYGRNIRTAGMGGICTELTASAYKNQDMNVSFLCSGTRFAGAWRDDEVGISFPYKVFHAVLDGLFETMNNFESDEKKEEIYRRAEKAGMNLTIRYGENYHGSSLGVAQMGVKGYRQKISRRKKDGGSDIRRENE
jgi:uncharacterized protein (DUF169 family)